MDRRRNIIALAVALAALALYIKTLAPTVTLVDSGELITACYKLDIGHPPGFPLFVLIGWLFSRLPFGNVAVRLNFMSAFFAALTAAVLFLLAVKIDYTKKAPPPGKKKPKQKPQQTPPQPAWIASVAAAVAALSFAASRTFWQYATIAEVYTLNAFLMAIIIFFLWGEFSEKRLWIASFTFGLGLGVHIVSTVFLVPPILYWLWANREKGINLPVTIRCAVAITLGFCVYLYLPIRASQTPLLNWGNPDTLQRFYWHITGKQYSVNLVSTSAERATERLGYFFKLWWGEFTWAGFVILAIGFVVIWRKQRRLFWFLLLLILADLAWSCLYDIAEDNEAYAIPLFLVSCLSLAAAIQTLLERWKASVILALLPVLIAVVHHSRNDHSQAYVASDFIHNAMSVVEPNGMMLTMDWQFYSPFFYLQHVEEFRSDVVCVDVNLFRRSWYVAYLKRQYPWLMEQSKDQVQAYLDQLFLFEHDRPYDAAVIQARFVDVLNQMIEVGSQSREVYVDLSLKAEPEVTRGMAWVPQGTLFRLYREFPPEPPPDAKAQWARRGLSGSPDLLDEVSLRIRENYALMLLNRGIFLALYHRHQEALGYFARSLEINQSAMTYWKQALSFRALGRIPEARKAYESALALDPGNEALRNESAGL